MKKQALVLAIIIALLFAGKAMADALANYISSGGLIHLATPIAVTTSDTSTGVSQANVTSIHASVPNSSTTVSLTAPSTIIDVWTSTDAAPLHIDWTNTTATSTNAAILPGGTYRFNGRGTSISAFKVIGDSATGTYNVVAN